MKQRDALSYLLAKYPRDTRDDVTNWLATYGARCLLGNNRLVDILQPGNLEQITAAARKELLAALKHQVIPTRRERPGGKYTSSKSLAASGGPQGARSKSKASPSKKDETAARPDVLSRYPFLDESGHVDAVIYGAPAETPLHSLAKREIHRLAQRVFAEFKSSAHGIRLSDLLEALQALFEGDRASPLLPTFAGKGIDLHLIRSLAQEALPSSAQHALRDPSNISSSSIGDNSIGTYAMGEGEIQRQDAAVDLQCWLKLVSHVVSRLRRIEKEGMGGLGASRGQNLVSGGCSLLSEHDSQDSQSFHSSSLTAESLGEDLGHVHEHARRRNDRRRGMLNGASKAQASRSPPPSGYPYPQAFEYDFAELVDADNGAKRGARERYPKTAAEMRKKSFRAVPKIAANGQLKVKSRERTKEKHPRQQGMMGKRGTRPAGMHGVTLSAQERVLRKDLGRPQRAGAKPKPEYGQGYAMPTELYEAPTGSQSKFCVRAQIAAKRKEHKRNEARQSHAAMTVVAQHRLRKYRDGDKSAIARGTTDGELALDIADSFLHSEFLANLNGMSSHQSHDAEKHDQYVELGELDKGSEEEGGGVDAEEHALDESDKGEQALESDEGEQALESDGDYREDYSAWLGEYDAPAKGKGRAEAWSIPTGRTSASGSVGDNNGEGGSLFVSARGSGLSKRSAEELQAKAMARIESMVKRQALEEDEGEVDRDEQEG